MWFIKPRYSIAISSSNRRYVVGVFREVIVSVGTLLPCSGRQPVAPAPPLHPEVHRDGSRWPGSLGQQRGQRVRSGRVRDLLWSRDANRYVTFYTRRFDQRKFYERHRRLFFFAWGPRLHMRFSKRFLVQNSPCPTLHRGFVASHCVEWERHQRVIWRRSRAQFMSASSEVFTQLFAAVFVAVFVVDRALVRGKPGQVLYVKSCKQRQSLTFDAVSFFQRHLHGVRRPGATAARESNDERTAAGRTQVQDAKDKTGGHVGHQGSAQTQAASGEPLTSRTSPHSMWRHIGPSH